MAHLHWAIAFLFCRLFCGQPGKRLPDIAGEVEGPQRAHRAVAAQLHRAGDARGMSAAASAFPPRARMCSASVSAGMARGVWAATVTNRFASGSSSASISSTSLSAMMLSRKTNFCPGKRSRRLWTVARIPWAL